MEYRIDKESLMIVMAQWNRFLRRRVHLIACGGTAMTLLGVKPSTKDVDFMVPKLNEHRYLIDVLTDIGYKQITASGWRREGELFTFDLFTGNRIHTTELLASPLEKGHNQAVQKYSHLFIGILNEYDLISSKLVRGTSVDIDDCMMLVKLGRNINIERLRDHYKELIKYQIGTEKQLAGNLDQLISRLRDEGTI